MKSKFNLKVLNRLILLNILPKQTNFLALKLIKDLEDKISFNENEQKELELKILENGLPAWNGEKDKGKEFEIGEKTQDIIIDALKKLDKDNKLTKDHFSTYEMFVKE